MNQPLETTIIYNPISTGNSKQHAEELRDSLSEKGFPVVLTETEYAGHAVELARNSANENPNAYIVSSSGDGGYHEIINGILTSEHPSAIAGLLPSGNANDHYNFVHHGDLLTRINDQDIDAIDVLKVVTTGWTRYAHSYVGLGVTPQIGAVLTEHTLNPFNEAWIVVSELFKVHPVKVRIDGRVKRYDHMVMSTIGKMSKYLNLDDTASVTDGQFEINVKRHGTFLELIGHLLKAATTKANDAQKAERREMTILRSTSIQLDGEVFPLRGGDTIVVTCEKKVLRCIV